jgi:long-chain acyl-CoA synthetase
MKVHYENLVDLYRTCCARYADRPVLGTKKDGAWHWTTYGQLRGLIDDIRGGLVGAGLEPGDRVGFIGDNSVEWAAACYATYGVGAAFVPMYLAQRPSEWQFILDDCDAPIVFVATEAAYDAMQGVRASLPKLRRVIGLARPDGAPDSFKALAAAGRARPVPAIDPEPDSIAGFIYTSGTTGKPKGAKLTHRNIVSNVESIHELYEIDAEERYLSFLPWAHSYGQTVELHMLLSFGASTALNDDLNKLLDNMAEVKPTVLVAVPRIFNRIYDAVSRELAVYPGLLERIVRGNLSPAEQGIVDRIRGKFGGRLKMVFGGSAVLSQTVAEFINALGINVYEGYGLTETSPVATTNSPKGRKFGTVGPAIPGVKIVIDRQVTGDPIEGEILVYGPNVMLGYHNRPEENAATLMPDGGLRTGDLGHLDEDGYLTISGRIKEQYKLANGKYVMPSVLEEKLRTSPFIANAMIYGDGREFNVALVVPSALALAPWAKQQGIALPEDLTKDPRVRALLAAEVERIAADFKGFERPRDIVFVRDDFTIGNGLLTPTLKLKRRDVLARYRDVIDACYARKGA